MRSDIGHDHGAHRLTRRFWTPAAVALVVLGLGSEGCRKAEPAPAPAPATQPNTDAGLKQLLKRADELTPKDAPDAQPARPSDGADPPPIVIVDGRRPGYSPPQPWYSHAPSDKGPTDVEKMNNQARQMFWYRISAVAQRILSLDSLRAQQRAACSGSKTLTFGGNSTYNPNGVPAASSTSVGSASYAIDNSASPQCRSVTGNLAYQEAAIRREQDQIEIDANRAGIYPGVIRDLYNRAGVR